MEVQEDAVQSRRNGTSQHNASGKATVAVEAIPRIACTMFCIVALILVTQIIPAIDQVEDQLHEFGNGYNDADSYRSAALFLVCVSSTATAIEIFMISIRCFCLMTSSIMEKIFKFYAFVDATFCFLFGLSFLGGGIVTSVYADDNQGLHDSLCMRDYYGDYLYTNDDGDSYDECDDLARLAALEIATGVICFITMICFGVLFLIMFCGAFASSGCSCCDDIAKVREPNQQVYDHSTQPPARPSNVITSRPYPMPYHPATNTSSYVSPSAPPYAPVNIPSYTSGEPPSYEMALAYSCASPNKYEPPGHGQLDESKTS